MTKDERRELAIEQCQRILAWVADEKRRMNAEWEPHIKERYDSPNWETVNGQRALLAGIRSSVINRLTLLEDE